MNHEYVDLLNRMRANIQEAAEEVEALHGDLNVSGLPEEMDRSKRLLKLAQELAADYQIVQRYRGEQMSVDEAGGGT